MDVGGGVSTLVDYLLTGGYKNVTLLDISAFALAKTEERLGDLAATLGFIEGDVCRYELPKNFDLWHDRAVFHFLTSSEDRKSYVESLTRALKEGGHAIIATFSPGGPSKCSGLDVVRYSAETLSAEIGSGFALIESITETHVTPMGAPQEFIYCLFAKL